MKEWNQWKMWFLFCPWWTFVKKLTRLECTFWWRFFCKTFTSSTHVQLQPFFMSFFSLQSTTNFLVKCIIFKHRACRSSSSFPIIYARFKHNSDLRWRKKPKLQSSSVQFKHKFILFSLCFFCIENWKEILWKLNWWQMCNFSDLCNRDL